MDATMELLLRGDHITLDALLKASGLADSGGTAKRLIAAGEVRVNAEVETRRGRKLRAGDRVQLGQAVLAVKGPAAPGRGATVRAS
jgi:ribosome-associated protein